jgi:DNA-directed RNA polymerase subunit RPC12/RpoP
MPTQSQIWLLPRAASLRVADHPSASGIEIKNETISYNCVTCTRKLHLPLHTKFLHITSHDVTSACPYILST